MLHMLGWHKLCGSMACPSVKCCSEPAVSDANGNAYLAAQAKTVLAHNCTALSWQLSILSPSQMMC